MNSTAFIYSLILGIDRSEEFLKRKGWVRHCCWKHHLLLETSPAASSPDLIVTENSIPSTDSSESITKVNQPFESLSQ